MVVHVDAVALFRRAGGNGGRGLAPRQQCTRAERGQSREKPAPLQVSNVMVVCPTCKKATRVSTVTKTVKDKTIRVRVCKNPACGQEIDK